MKQRYMKCSDDDLEQLDRLNDELVDAMTIGHLRIPRLRKLKR